MHPRDHASDDAVSRALRVLTLLGSTDQPLGVSEVARQSGLAKTTAHRILGVLVASGYVAREGAQYRGSVRLSELSAGGMQLRLRNAAAPWVAHLFVASRGQTVHLGILSGSDVVYLDKAARPGTRGRVPTEIGGRVPATCSALGKVMLAFDERRRVEATELVPMTAASIRSTDRLDDALSVIRRTGIGVDSNEAFDGLTCVSAPISNGSVVVAALSIAGPEGQIDRTAHGRLVAAAARHVSASLSAGSEMGGPRAW